LGDLIIADQVATAGPSSGHFRTIIYLLAGSVALMMTGFGIIMPIFARRFGELGGGVQALGLMTMAFALAQFVAAPITGSLADRYGRRPFILLALAAFAIANVGFLFASSTLGFTAVRALEGALTAGLFPAAMGVVADVAPAKERGQWVGIVMASYGAGFIFGPVLGGLLYDAFGYAVPFIASAAMAVLALLAASILVPETRTPVVRRREMLRRRRDAVTAVAPETSLWESLPRPLLVFATLLLIDFALVFAFAFIEPQMVFYLYDELGWSTVRFGVVVAVYGLSVVIGQLAGGRLSDRFARKPIIVAGLVLNLSFYAGLAFLTSFPLLLLVAALSGLGEALVLPALSAFVLDLTQEQHRSRVMGIKESAVALGGVLGPLTVVAVSAYISPQGVFMVSAALMVFITIIALVDLRVSPSTSQEMDDTARSYAARRALVAQATLRGIVCSASEAREMRTAT
jgi:MFS family permease